MSTESSILVRPLKHRLLAEGLGTFVLCLSAFVVIAGRARAMSDPISMEVGRLGTLGVTLMALIVAGDRTSAHFNPAVTVAVAITQRWKATTAAAYVAVQTTAAFAAAIAATVLIGGPTRRVLPNAARVGSVRAFASELLATLVLVAVYLATEKRNRPARPLLAGLAVVLGAAIIGRSTTLGINPARSLGAAMWNRFGSTTWIFIAAPLLAGVIGALAARTVARVSERTAESHAARSSVTVRELIGSGTVQFVGAFAVSFLGYAALRSQGGVVSWIVAAAGPIAVAVAASVLFETTTFFQPTITLALGVARRISGRQMAAWLAAQVLGTCVGVIALRAWLIDDEVLQAVPIDRFTVVRLFALQAGAVGVFVAVSLRATASGPVWIGASYVGCTVLAMTFSLASFGRFSLNPAWTIATTIGRGNVTAARHLAWVVPAAVLASVVVGIAHRQASGVDPLNPMKET